MDRFHKQKEYFENAFKNGRLAHAYLFSGPAGIGKKDFALNLFQLVNARKELNENDPDLKIVSSNHIEDIRDLKSFAYITPFYGPYKFIIIDDAHRLTADASNALLKILEEPPQSVKFILISSRLSDLLPTISSRCQEISFMADTETVRKASLKRLSKEILEFHSILDAGIVEKFQFAKKIHEQGNYLESVSCWLNWAYVNRDQLNNPKLLKDLLELHAIVSQSQFNPRLALENFLLDEV